MLQRSASPSRSRARRRRDVRVDSLEKAMLGRSRRPRSAALSPNDIPAADSSSSGGDMPLRCRFHKCVRPRPAGGTPFWGPLQCVFLHLYSTSAPTSEALSLEKPLRANHLEPRGKSNPWMMTVLGPLGRRSSRARPKSPNRAYGTPPFQLSPPSAGQVQTTIQHRACFSATKTTPAPFPNPLRGDGVP